MEQRYDLLIIGSGPAGMTAAIYGARANLNVAVLEVMAPGGKLVKTAEIENWPGVEKISGVDLAMQMYGHMSNLKVQYLNGKVIEIVDHGSYKEIKCENAVSYEARAIIIATGTNEIMMNVENEVEYTSRGVSYCAVCDGAFFREKVVSVVGGGNSALEEALYLCQFAKQVNIVIRRDVFRADPLVVEHVKENPKIVIHTKKMPSKVLGDGSKVIGLEVKDSETNEISVIETDGIFPFIGAKPATDFVMNLGICDDQGYLLVNEKMETKIPGIYGAGDVCAKILRQIVTATSDGAIAAQQCHHYLNQKA